MYVGGIYLDKGMTVSFDYNRKTASGMTGRIGTIDKIDPINGTVTIQERVDGREQFRAFKASAMVNVLAE